jgi:hypothetical protein
LRLTLQACRESRWLWRIATTDQKSNDSAYVWDYNWNGAISPVAVQDNIIGSSVLTLLTSPAAAVLGTKP